MKNQWKTMMALMLCAGVANAAYVTIGGAGNSNDGTGNQNYGGVSYEYKISSTEVTIQQMADSGAGDGDENYWNDGTRNVGLNAPAVNVSLYEARKYCNWLSTGNVNSGYYGAGGNNMSGLSHIEYATANGKTYFVPTEDEWYKAAYWKGGDDYSLYANGSDTVPTHGTTSGWNYWNDGYVNGDPNYTWEAGYGGEEQNGTYDMMGNVWEWMEDSAGVIRGGSCYDSEGNLRSSYRGGHNPSGESVYAGFRPVEVIPEPATAGLLGISAIVFYAIRRIKNFNRSV